MLRRFAVATVTALVLATAGVWAFASPPREGFPADPPAHSSEKQWVFEVAYDKGASSITSAKSATAKKPIATARSMGRFALEFWIGPELLDRVRFDVPLLGDDEHERNPKSPLKKPKFSRVTTKLKVQMADHSRATVLAFVDRATGDTRRFFWPPDEKGQLTPFSAKAATTGAPISTTGAVAPTAAPSSTPSATPSGTPIAAPSSVPSATPSGAPIAAPSGTPSATPSGTPTASSKPGVAPSGTPTAAPARPAP